MLPVPTVDCALTGASPSRSSPVAITKHNNARQLNRIKPTASFIASPPRPHRQISAGVCGFGMASEPPLGVPFCECTEGRDGRWVGVDQMLRLNDSAVRYGAFNRPINMNPRTIIDWTMRNWI